MDFISIRDLRDKPAQVRKRLVGEKEIVLTLNGKPFALLSAISSGNIEDILLMSRRIRAWEAVGAMQTQSVEKGKDKLTLDEINSVIGKVRKDYK